MLQRWGPWGYFAPTRATPTAFTASCTIEGGQRFREKKSFPIESFHWEVLQTRRPRPAEAEKRARGDPIAKLEIVLANGSSKAVYRFTDVFVTSVRPGGSASSGDEPREEVSFSGIFESSSHSQ